MIIVSTRDFRANQGRYLRQARDGEDVIIKSRDHGSFKVTPVTKDDTIYGKGNRKRDDESVEQYLDRLNNKI